MTILKIFLGHPIQNFVQHFLTIPTHEREPHPIVLPRARMTKLPSIPHLSAQNCVIFSVSMALRPLDFRFPAPAHSFRRISGFHPLFPAYLPWISAFPRLLPTRASVIPDALIVCHLLARSRFFFAHCVFSLAVMYQCDAICFEMTCTALIIRCAALKSASTSATVSHTYSLFLPYSFRIVHLPFPFCLPLSFSSRR